jgi:NADH:ubiquinone oxidoreductase subunit 5 (subunit L)/multisubunit Na+/H+ antiporter MnhA subunit
MPWTAAAFCLGGFAISALPPLNGFVSELLIYAGLLDPSVPTGVPRALLVVAAAALAFVGGVSALAMTRAFGITFLGSARDPKIHCEGEVTRSMRFSMAVHGLGVVALGLLPGLGLALVEQPARLFRARLPEAGPLGALEPVRLLGPIAWMGLLLLAVLGALLLLRRRLLGPAPTRRHVTWGCGYTAGTPRIQYTGASFSSQLAGLFYAVLPVHRREQLPEGPFPERTGHVNTHCVDAVEKRMFEVMGEGDALVTRVAERAPIGPGLSLGAGLVALAAMVALLLAGTGGVR